MLKQLLADLADPNNFELDPRDLCVKFAAWHRSAVKLLAADILVQATTIAEVDETAYPDLTDNDIAVLRELVPQDKKRRVVSTLTLPEVTSVEQKDLHSERKVWSPTVGITKEPRGWEKFK